jgi:hypothetical protein
MALNTLNTDAISFKKLSGKVHTQQNFAVTEEGISTNVQSSYSTVFANPIVSLPVTTSGLTALYATNGIVERVKFQIDIIPDTQIAVGRSQGYRLKLPSDYNTFGELYPEFSAGTYLHNAIGKLQIVPSLYGELKPDGSTEYDPILYQTNGSTVIAKFDPINWYFDPYSGIVFVQDPPVGYDSSAARPGYLEAFLYVGDYLDDILFNMSSGTTGTTGLNVGGGVEVFKDKVAETLRFRTINGTNGISVTGTSNNIIISFTGSSGGGTITGATNGLNIAGGGSQIGLGGNLTGDTTISSTTAKLSIEKINGSIESYLLIRDSSMLFNRIDTGVDNSVEVDSSGVVIQAFDTGYSTSIQVTPFAQITLGSDNPTFQGAIYLDDYSSGFTNRSLVDKGYVTGQTLFFNTFPHNNATLRTSEIQLSGYTVNLVSGSSNMTSSNGLFGELIGKWFNPYTLFEMWVKVAGVKYFIELSNIANSNSATISEVYSDYYDTSVGSTWPFGTGTYDVFYNLDENEGFTNTNTGVRSLVVGTAINNNGDHSLIVGNDIINEVATHSIIGGRRIEITGTGTIESTLVLSQSTDIPLTADNAVLDTLLIGSNNRPAQYTLNKAALIGNNNIFDGGGIVVGGGVSAYGGGQKTAFGQNLMLGFQYRSAATTTNTITIAGGNYTAEYAASTFVDVRIPTGSITYQISSVVFSAGSTVITTSTTIGAPYANTTVNVSPYRGSTHNSFAVGEGIFGKEVKVGADNSYIISRNTSAQVVGHGVLSQDSIILGGLNHNIPATSPRSAILGGNGIKAVASVPDTVYLPKVRIGQGTGGAITSGSTSSDVIVRNIGGILETRTISSLISSASGVTTANNGLTKSGSNVRLGGTLTGTTTINTTATADFRFNIVNDSKFNIEGNENGGGLEFRTDAGGQEGLYLAATNTAGQAVGIFFDATSTYGNSDNGLKVFDGRPTGAGLEYYADYSANFTPRSLVDKGYVDGIISGSSVSGYIVTASTFTATTESFIGVSAITATTIYLPTTPIQFKQYIVSDISGNGLTNICL